MLFSKPLQHGTFQGPYAHTTHNQVTSKFDSSHVLKCIAHTESNLPITQPPWTNKDGEKSQPFRINSFRHHQLSGVVVIFISHTLCALPLWNTLLLREYLQLMENQPPIYVRMEVKTN